ncbi:hypothetical protein BD414DRAFT_440026 [Trametes punicea]|nr:hypothetical protein BD414DRAFT_440026 [Trametes punicea]
MASQDNHLGRKSFAPERRCHWFDSNGRPFKRLDGGLGCPRGPRCYFAHPTELEAWRNARPGGDPPLHYLTNDEYRLIVGRHRSPPPPRGVHPGPRPRSLSPGRRRSPPRLISREREPPPLAQRMRRQSASREREPRQFIPRSSRSKSPGRGRIHRTPPLPPRGPRMSMGGPTPDGPRRLPLDTRSPVVFPKNEHDVPMRDATKSEYKREDSVASSHQAAQPQTPPRPPQAQAATAKATYRPVTPPVPAPVNTSPAVAQAPSAGPAPSDALKSLLESSALQWQQISSAVAAASSVTTGISKTTPSNGTPDEALGEDKARIWSSRIELLAAAVRTHNDCRSLESDVRDYQQLVESFSYQNLSAEDKAVIDGHLHTLQSRLAERTEEVKKSLSQLADSKYWLTYSDKAKASPQERSQEIAKQMHSLKVSVSHLQELFQTVEARWEQASKSLNTNRNGLAVDIFGASQGIGQSNALIAGAIVPKELEKIRGAIASFEERLGSLENAALHSSELMLEQLDVIVAENVQALILCSTGAVQAKPPQPRPTNALTAHQLKVLERLQQHAAVTTQQVQQLSQEVTELASVKEQLQTKNSQLLAENAQLRQQLAEAMVVQLPTNNDSAKLDQIQAALRALNAAVVAYHAERPSTSPSLPPAETLVEQIGPQIATSVLKMMTPELQGFRDQVQELLRSQQAEVKNLVNNLAATRDSIGAIRDLVDKVSALEGTENGTVSDRSSTPAANGSAAPMET